MATKTIKRRTTPRVQDTEDNRGSVRKTAAHRGATVTADDNGLLRFVGQGSELVPVAQYASVTIGPVLIEGHVSGPDISLLGEVEWPDDPDMEPDWPSDNHREVFEALVNQGVGLQRVVDTIISRDRALVEESIRLYNEREAEEEAAAAKKKSTRTRSR